MKMLALVSRTDDGTTEIAEASGVEARCSGNNGNTEVAMFTFDNDEDAYTFKDELNSELRELGVFFKLRVLNSNDDPEEVMLDILAEEK